MHLHWLLLNLMGAHKSNHFKLFLSSTDTHGEITNTCLATCLAANITSIDGEIKLYVCDCYTH